MKSGITVRRNSVHLTQDAVWRLPINESEWSKPPKMPHDLWNTIRRGRYNPAGVYLTWAEAVVAACHFIHCPMTRDHVDRGAQLFFDTLYAALRRWVEQYTTLSRHNHVVHCLMPYQDSFRVQWGEIGVIRDNAEWATRDILEAYHRIQHAMFAR